jgi:polysaccharide export outer membrane protein
MRLFLSILVLIFLCTCTNPPYRGGDVLGADEFVMDSYQIREGKFSILQMQGKDLGALSTQFLEEYPDVIQERDILQIVIYHPTRTDIGEAVQRIGSLVGFRVESGKILIPDLDPIEVAGLTLEEAREKIKEKYLEQIRDIEVFITYRDRIERKVELAGLVQIPSIPVDGRIRLFEVLSVAKVPTQANFFKSYVIRDDQLLAVDLFKLMKEGDMSQNIVMRGGDKIYIADAPSSSLMVLGEVGKEKVVDLPNGFMTLRQALAEAGGIPCTGDKAFIQVIRGNILHPKIYTLNWHHVIHLPSDSMLLIPGDIVYVAATPLTEWNRFVNQILPTLVGFDLLTKGVKNVGITLP